jgi:MATE family multidrug resistance protein
VTILTAKTLGANQAIHAQYFVYSALIIGLSIGILIAGIYIFSAQQLILLFMRSDHINTAVINLSMKFFIIAAIFQLFDSIQVISFGALRGYGDTYIPMYLGGFSYWIFGLSAGYVLAFHWGFEGRGLWTGLAIGIAISAFFLSLRLRMMIKKNVISLA